MLGHIWLYLAIFRYVCGVFVGFYSVGVINAGVINTGSSMQVLGVINTGVINAGVVNAGVSMQVLLISMQVLLTAAKNIIDKHSRVHQQGKRRHTPAAHLKR